MVEFQLKNEQQTLDLGSRLGQCLETACMVYLEGELGSGKTTFVRGLLTGLGYNNNVKSPTYTIVESYSLDRFEIYHFDLYRLADPEELEYLGIRDYFGENTVALVEWPEKGQGFLPYPDLTVCFKYKNPGRMVSINSNTGIGEHLLHEFVIHN